ncbi:MAG: hypothetical protein WA659_03965 [Candidatus Aquirickettsiella sp.]
MMKSIIYTWIRKRLYGSDQQWFGDLGLGYRRVNHDAAILHRNSWKYPSQQWRFICCFF